MKENKIILVSTFFGAKLGGAEESIGLLYEELKKVGIDVVVLSTRAYLSNIPGVFQIPGTRFIPNKILLLGFKFLDTYLSWQLKRAIRPYSCSGLHVQDLYLLPATKLVGNGIDVPVISHVREDIHKKIYPFNYPAILVKIGNYLLKKRSITWVTYLNKVDYIIAVSHFIRNSLIKLGIDEQKISVVYNIVPAQKLPGQTHITKYDQDKYTFLLSGRITTEKGHGTLIEALIKIKEYNYEIRIAGEGPFLKHLLKSIKINGLTERVKYIGKLTRTSMNEEYLNCDYVLQLSHVAEGFGRTVIEASRFNKFVIVTDVGAARETVIEGQSGLLISPNSAESIKQVFGKLLKRDGVLSPTKDALTKLNERFDTSQSIKNLLSVYQNVISIK